MKKSIAVLVTLLVISLAFNIFHTTKPKSASSSIAPHAQLEETQVTPSSIPPIPSEPPVVPVMTEQDSPKNVFSYAELSGRFGINGCYSVNKITALFRNFTMTPRLDEIKILPAPSALYSIHTERYWGNETNLIIEGAFAIGTDYTVILPEGLLFAVKGKKPEPSVVFTEHARYYPYSPETENASSLLIPVSSVNQEKCTVKAYRLADRNLALPQVPGRQEYMEQTGEKTFDLPKSIDRKITTLLDFGSLLGDRKPGYYKLVLSSNDKERWYWYDSSMKSCDIIISDLGITLTHSDHTAAVTVHSLNTNQPVAGAKLQFFSKKFDLIATSTTKEDGSATLQYKNDYDKENDPPYALIASTENDISCLYLNETSEHSTAAFKNTGREFSDGPEAFLTTERGIYRPGENVELTILVRKAEENESLALETPAFLKITDATSKLIAKQTIQTDKNGIATITVPLPASAKTGTYQAVCGLDDKHSWGSTSFLVGDFTPDRVKFSIQAPEMLKAGENSITFSYSADFYYGSPVQEGLLNAVLTASPAHVPKHWTDYSVGTQEKTYGEIARNSWNLQGLGSKFRLPVNPPSDWNIPLVLTATGTISEPTSRPVSATAKTLYLPTDQFIGLKYDDEQSILRAALLSWKQDESPKENVNVQFAFQRKEWNYVTVDGRHQWTLETMDSGDLGQFAVETAEGTIPLNNLQSGYYTITATNAANPQMRTQIQFWHSAGDAGSVYSSNPSILTVKADKETYAEGDVAELTVEAISDGFAVVAAGEREISTVFALPVQKGTNLLRVPLPEKLLTDRCYAAVTLVGTHQEETVRSFALLRFTVDNSSRRLPVEIALPQKTEPSQEVEVTLRAPAGSAVRAWAVDEGILSLTDYKTPNPFAFFFQNHCSSFHSLDIYGELFSNQAIRAPKQIGGDAAAFSERLPKLKLPENAIYTFPVVTMPENGETTLRFTPKGFTGALRVIAVAADERHVGSADSSIAVRDKVIVLPYAPTVVAPTDIFPVKFRIDAKESFPELITVCKITTEEQSADAGQFLLSLRIPDGLKAVAQESTLFQGTTAGEAIVPFLTLQAMHTGEFELEYTLLGPDNIRIQGKIPVNVRSLHPAQTFIQTSVVKPGESWTAQKVDNLLSPARIQLATTPQVSVAECINWLHDYPYQCLEQTVSIAFPFLAIRKSNLEPFCKYTEARTMPIVVKLLQMRRGTRGFAHWPDSQNIWTEASIYAAHFLFAVESPLVDDATKEEIVVFLRDVARTTRECRAYASYVLSYAGKKYAQESAQMARVVLTTEQQPCLATLLAAATLFRTGYAVEAAPHLQAAMDAFVWEKKDYWQKTDHGIPGILDYLETRKALALAILCQFAPDSDCLHGIAKELVASLRNGGNCWGNTISNAWTSTALILYQDRFPASRIRGSVFLGEKETPFETDSVNSMETDSIDRLIVKNTGDSPIYVTVNTLTENAPLETKSTVAVVKEILDANGSPTTSWQAGDLLTVRITFDAQQPLDNAVLEDRLAGCFEIEDGNLATRQKNRVLERPEDGYPKEPLHPVFQESRTDRYLFFGAIPAGKSWFDYNVRVVCDGTFAMPPAHVEDMYLPERQGTSPSKP